MGQQRLHIDSGPRRRVVRALLLVFTGLALAIIFLRIPARDVLSALRRTDARFVVLAVLLSLWLNTVQSALAFRHAVRASGAALSYADALRATLANLTLHNLLPAGSGNFGLAAIVHHRHGVPLAQALFAAGALLWLKLCCLLLLGSCASVFAPVAASLRVSLGAAFVASLLLGAFGARLLPWIAQRMRSTILRPISEFLAQRAPAQSGAVLRASLHTLLLVAGEVVVFHLALYALDQQVAWAQVLVRVPLVLIAAKLPVTLLGLGTREAVALVLFADLVPAPDIVAATLVFLALTGLLPAVVGAFFTPASLPDDPTQPDVS